MCGCKPHIVGEKCDECSPGITDFPACGKCADEFYGYPECTGIPISAHCIEILR